MVLFAVIDILGISDPSVAWLVVSVINGLILERLWCNEQIAIDEQMELLGKILTTYLQKNC